MREAFLREQEERVNTLVYDSVQQFDGSISAEHGIGALKVDKLREAQVAGGAGHDARHQAGARPAEPA